GETARVRIRCACSLGDYMRPYHLRVTSREESPVDTDPQRSQYAGSSALPPAGFTQQKVTVGSVGIDYVIGGQGPTLVLLHGYPQSWYEWRHVLPALAEHYTVIAPSLRGAGLSDAPPTGYDKKTLAADIHGLLVQIGHDKNIRLVGHDIGL